MEGAELAVVVTGGSEGGTELVRLQARQLAVAGVSALAVGYHGFKRRPTLANIALELFAEALARARVGLDQVAVSGARRPSLVSHEMIGRLLWRNLVGRPPRPP